MAMYRRLAVVFGLVLALVWASPANASPATSSALVSHCGTKWRNADQTESLNWCVSLLYNDTTGNIRGAFDYSDYQAGNVYAIRIVDVTLWRDANGTVSVKDTCDYCPDDEFVYDDANQVGTGWGGYACDRLYRVTATFRIQWDSSSDLIGGVTRGTDWAQLC
jgi:hypothetical protein